MSKNKNTDCCIKKTSIGGQALMEGIMMRGPEKSAMAVRNTDGEIVLEKFETETKKRSKFCKLPVVRGLFNYIDSMAMGMKCLMRSAEISGLEEAEEEMRREKEAKKAAKAAKKAEKKGIQSVETPVAIQETTVEAAEPADTVTSEVSESKAKGEEIKAEEKKESSALTGTIMVLGSVLGVLLAVGLFFVLPSYIFDGVAYLIPGLRPENRALASLIKSVFEGMVKIILLVGYMGLISLMPDIKRTFQYHGAEHKTIFCYEKGLELTVENVRLQKRFHPRCGTSFLILMLLVSILISFFIDPLYQLILGEATYDAIAKPLMTTIRAFTKILLIPLIVGLGYELIKIAGRHDNLLTRIISAPGVWLQHVTVLEPDDGMIECAIAAVKEVIPNDESDKW